METVTSVQPRDDFQLELIFNTGEAAVFDMRPYLDKDMFRRLHDITLFKQAYIAFDTVCWPEIWILRQKHFMTAATNTLGLPLSIPRNHPHYHLPPKPPALHKPYLPGLFLLGDRWLAKFLFPHAACAFQFGLF